MKKSKEEILELEVEKRSLMETISSLAAEDGRMNTKTDDLCCKLEHKIKEIQQIINSNI